MQCKCGGETVSQSHPVKMMETKIKWIGRDYKNPIRVDSDICNGCGRIYRTFFDNVTKVRILPKT